jgi:hypothetical protein
MCRQLQTCFINNPLRPSLHKTQPQGNQPMFWIAWILLVLLGLLGISAVLKSRNPQARQAMAQLESVGGWIGLVGLIWGVLHLIRALLNISVLTVAPFAYIIWLVVALVLISLGLLLAVPTIQQLAGRGNVSGLNQLAAKVAPFKVILGVVALVVAVLSLF